MIARALAARAAFLAVALAADDDGDPIGERARSTLVPTALAR